MGYMYIIQYPPKKTHTYIYIYIYIYIEDACGEYRRPLSSLRDLCRGTLPKKIKENTLKKLFNFKAESIKM